MELLEVMLMIEYYSKRHNCMMTLKLLNLDKFSINSHFMLKKKRQVVKEYAGNIL